MATNRDEAVRLRASAKKRCTSKRNQILGIMTREANPEDPELLNLLDKFMENINVFNDCCDQAAEFADDSGPEEKADQEYSEKVLGNGIKIQKL